MVSSTPSYNAPVAAEAPEEPEEEEEEEATDADAVAALTKRWQLPVSHEARLQPASKAVSAIASDPAGGRVIVGSLDYKVRLYDFGGMDRRHRPFREIEPGRGASRRGAVVLADGRSIPVLYGVGATEDFSEGRPAPTNVQPRRPVRDGHGADDGPRDDRDGRPVAPAREDAVLDFWDGRVSENLGLVWQDRVEGFFVM